MCTSTLKASKKDADQVTGQPILTTCSTHTKPS